MDSADRAHHPDVTCFWWHAGGTVRAQEPVTGPANDDDPKSSPEVNEMANMHIIDNCSLVFFVYAPIALFSPKTILIDYLQCPSKASLLSLLVSWAL